MRDQQIIHQTGNGSIIENEVNRRFEPELLPGHFSLLQVLAVHRKLDRKSHAGKDAVSGWRWWCGGEDS